LNGRVGKDGGVRKFTCFSEASQSVIAFILVNVLLRLLCVDFEVRAAVGSKHLPVKAAFEWVSSKKLATNSDRKKKRRENEDLGIRKALKVIGEKEKDFQSMMMSEKAQQELEKCFDLLGDGKIKESLALAYDVVYEVGSKLNSDLRMILRLDILMVIVNETLESFRGTVESEG